MSMPGTDMTIEERKEVVENALDDEKISQIHTEVDVLYTELEALIAEGWTRRDEYNQLLNTLRDYQRAIELHYKREYQQYKQTSEAKAREILNESEESPISGNTRFKDVLTVIASLKVLNRQAIYYAKPPASANIKSKLEDLWTVSGFSTLRFLTLVNEVRNSAGSQKLLHFKELFSHIGLFSPYTLWRAAVIGERLKRYESKIPLDPAGTETTYAGIQGVFLPVVNFVVGRRDNMYPSSPTTMTNPIMLALVNYTMIEHSPDMIMAEGVFKALPITFLEHLAHYGGDKPGQSAAFVLAREYRPNKQRSRTQTHYATAANNQV